jgi:hypothetical protein
MDDGRQRIVHQIWDWRDDRRYVVHLYITREIRDGGWEVKHLTRYYREVTPREIAIQAEKAGFRNAEVLYPATTGYYQPIFTASLE